MSKHFCCCIPVRAAVFFFSLLSLLSSGVVAAFAWFVVYGMFIQFYVWKVPDTDLSLRRNQLWQDRWQCRLQHHQYCGEDRVHCSRISLHLCCINLPLRVSNVLRKFWLLDILAHLVLCNLYSFIGAIMRNPRFVKAYSFLTWIVFFISLAAAGFYFYAIFSGKNLFKGCQITDTEGNTRDCTITLPLWEKIVSVVVTIVELFVQLCKCAEVFSSHAKLMYRF